MDKKILIACLSTRPPIIAVAGWRDQILHIIKISPLPTARTALDKELIPELKKYQEKGFDILIDEATPRISIQHGRPVRLSNVDPITGRPVLVEALMTYQELKQQMAITFPVGESSRYDIPASLVDEDRDLNGRQRYNVDWESLKSESAALLLCVYATTCNAVDSNVYLNAFINALDGTSAPKMSIADRFKAVTIDADMARAAGYPSYAGKKGTL